MAERLAPDLVDKVQPEKLVDPIFRDGLMEELGPEVWVVAEPQVQAAVATAITDNFLLAAAIVFVSVLAILRMKEIRLRREGVPSNAVDVQRPRPTRAIPSGPVVTSARDIPISLRPSRPARKTRLNGVSEVFDLELRGQVDPPSVAVAVDAAAPAPGLRRSVMAAAMLGAGVGFVLSLVYPRDGPD